MASTPICTTASSQAEPSLKRQCSDGLGVWILYSRILAFNKLLVRIREVHVPANLDAICGKSSRNWILHDRIFIPGGKLRCRGAVLFKNLLIYILFGPALGTLVVTIGCLLIPVNVSRWTCLLMFTA